MERHSDPSLKSRPLAAGNVGAAGRTFPFTEAGYLAGLLIGIAVLGTWIGASVANGKYLNYLVLVATAGMLPYLMKGFVGEILRFEYPLPLRYLIPLTSLYLAAQAAFPDIERRFYIGVLLLFFLLPSIVKAPYVHSCQKKILKAAYFTLFVIPTLSALYTLIFWSDEYKPYFLLRHLAIFPYIIFFFAAYKNTSLFLDTMRKWFWVPLVLAVPGAGFLRIGELILDISAIGGTVLFAWIYLGYLQRCRSSREALWGWVALIALLFLFRHQATTRIILAAFVLLIPFLNFLKYWHRLLHFTARKFIFLSMAIMMIIGIGSLLLILGNEIEENITYQIKILRLSEFAGVDLGDLEETRLYHSSLWRMSLWAYFLNRFFNYPFGIGLGTPGFEEGLSKIMAVGITETDSWEYQSHTLGAHNSFITLLARCGIIFLIPLGIYVTAIAKMLWQYWRRCRYRPLADRDSRVVFGSVVAFIAVLIEATFNMVIETPLYAAMFWFSFGLMTRVLGDYLAGEPSAVGNRWSARRLGLNAEC